MGPEGGRVIYTRPSGLFNPPGPPGFGGGLYNSAFVVRWSLHEVKNEIAIM